MFKNDKPVIIDNKYLLTTVYYNVLIQDQNKSADILVQIVTNQSLCVCRLLKKTSDNGITPHVYQFGILKVGESSFHYIIQQKGGPSLKLCIQLMKRKFTVQTIALLALKMITHLSQLHSLNIIHHCLKQSNIITTLQSEVYLTHLEYATKFMDKNGKFLTKKQNKMNPAVNRFSSIGTHLQQFPCPRDDLESLFYILLNIITQGKFLPSYQNVQRQEKLKYYYEIKQRFVAERELKGFPEQFLQLYHQIRLLTPNEFPNYEQLKQPFFQLLGQNELQLSFDWIPLLRPLNNKSSVTSLSPVKLQKLKHAGSVGDLAFLQQIRKQESIPDSASPPEVTPVSTMHHFQQSSRNNTTKYLPPIQEKQEAASNYSIENLKKSKRMFPGLSIVIKKQDTSSSGNISSMSDDQSEIDTKPIRGQIRNRSND